MLRFRLLGEPQIWYGDVRLDKLLSRKAVALLAYLACHDKSFRREWLATLLWSECEQSRAFFYLRKALWEIGNVMTSVGLDRSTFLEVDRDEMRWRSDAPYSLDAREFKQGGVDLYAPFLGTFTVNNAPEFEEWQRMQCAIFEMTLKRTTEASMTKREDVVLVKLGLGAMARDKGDAHAEVWFNRTLDDIATTPCPEFDIRKIKVMRDRLEERRGIGEKSAIQLLAQLGWFVSQTIDNEVASVVY